MALSLVAHAIGAAVLVLGARFSWPAAPIPIELVMPKPREPAPPPPPPEPPKPRAKAPARTPGEGKPRSSGSGGKARVEEPPPPPASDLRAYVPDDAILVVMISSEKLRKSIWRPDVDFLLSRLPDYRVLVTEPGLSLFEDFEALLIGTPDPRHAEVTFVAARYKESPKIRALDGRWRGEGDNRVFRFPKPGFGILALPDAAARLDASMAHADGGSGQWLAELEKFAKGDASQPALQVMLTDVRALARFGGGLPTPLTLALAATADTSPALRLKASFRTEDEAAQMEAAWPGIMARYRTATALLGLSAMLDGMKLSRHGVEIEIAGRIAEAQFRLGMSWARAAAPAPPPVPARAPPPAPAPATEAPDAGEPSR